MHAQGELAMLHHYSVLEGVQQHGEQPEAVVEANGEQVPAGVQGAAQRLLRELPHLLAPPARMTDREEAGHLRHAACMTQACIARACTGHACAPVNSVPDAHSPVQAAGGNERAPRAAVYACCLAGVIRLCNLCKPRLICLLAQQNLVGH